MRIWIFFCLIFFSQDIFGCSCNRVSIFKGQRQSDLVFVGRVIKVNEVVTNEKPTWGGGEIQYRRFEFVFKVTSIYKGRKNPFMKDTVTVVTTGGGADCGSWFDEDRKYLVYTWKIDKKLGQLGDQVAIPFMTTSLCTRTKRASILTYLERLVLKLS